MQQRVKIDFKEEGRVVIQITDFEVSKFTEKTSTNVKFEIPLLQYKIRMYEILTIEEALVDIFQLMYFSIA